jgi:hypothetical protein
MIGKKGVCIKCGESKGERWIVNAKHTLCSYHNTIRLQEGKPIKRTWIKKRSDKNYKVHNEEIQMFLEIWEERPHKSQVSGAPLGNEFNICFFSHILGKKAYPGFRLYKKNILLKTFKEHSSWDQGDVSDPMWDKVKILKQDLKEEYYNK